MNPNDKILFYIAVLVFVIAIAVMYCGCKGGIDREDCEDYDTPSGFSEFDRYSEGDYESVTYHNNNRWITFTSTDNGCTWDKSEYTANY